MSDYGVLIQLAWRNPYTQPPNGLRVLAEIFRPQSAPGARIAPAEFDFLHTFGDGYGNVFSFPSFSPMRELPPESLATVRRKRTARRMQKKYPLFADQFTQEAITENPEYYAGITRDDLAVAKAAVLSREAERMAYLSAHLGELMIYGKSHSLSMELSK